MIVRSGSYDLGGLGDAGVERPTLFAAGLYHAERGVAEQAALAIAFRLRVSDVGLYTMPAHGDGRQVITLVGKAQIARALDAHGPAIHPRPELIDFMRVEGKVACLLAIALEEARQSLSSVHYAQEPSIVDHFLVTVWRRSSGGDVAVRYRFEQWQELLIGF